MPIWLNVQAVANSIMSNMLICEFRQHYMNATHVDMK